MVGKAYLLDKPAAPSTLKRVVDQDLIPAAINALGSMEAVIERLAVRTRQQPLAILGAACGLGFLAHRLFDRRA